MFLKDSSNILPLYCFNFGLYKSFVRITTSWECPMVVGSWTTAVALFCWSCHHWLGKSQFFPSISFSYFSFLYSFILLPISNRTHRFDWCSSYKFSTATADMLTWLSMCWTNALALMAKMASKWEFALALNLHCSNKSLVAFACIAQCYQKTAVVTLKKLLFHSPHTVSICLTACPKIWRLKCIDLALTWIYLLYWTSSQFPWSGSAFSVLFHCVQFWVFL